MTLTSARLASTVSATRVAVTSIVGSTTVSWACADKAARKEKGKDSFRSMTGLLTLTRD
jgi:hypothetical protein